MKNRIIIFGGTGFIGQNLIESLLKKNYSITTVSRNKSKKINKIFRVNQIVCDVSKFRELKKKIKDEYDFVVNLSGNINHKNKKETIKTHYLGSKNIINIFIKKKIKLFIQVGSSLEYGDKSSPQKEFFNCIPKSFYGKAKLYATNYLKKISQKFFFPYIILRLYQVYGPHQKFDRLIPQTIKSCINDQKFKCSNGNQFRDFLYIDDLVDLFLKILKKQKIKTGIYNVGSGNPLQVKFIIKSICNLTKKGRPIFGSIKMRKDEINILYPSIKKIKKIFNWSPKISFINGLKKTISFYENS